MAAKRLMTPQQVKTAVAMYRDARLSIYDVGQRLGIPSETIRANLIKAGVNMRSAVESLRARYESMEEA